MTHLGASQSGDEVMPDAPQRGMLVGAACVSVVALAFIIAIRLYPNVFDRRLTETVDGISRSWPTFDYAIRAIDRYDLFQGVLLLTIASAALGKARNPSDRVTLIAGGVAAALAAALSRILQLLMPYSPRPMYDPHLPWKAPYGANFDALRDWSSFPSDHASLLFGIAIAILVVNRRLGAAALATACTLGLIRIYEGEHYLSDVLGGAILAILVLGVTLTFIRPFERQLCALAEKHPGLSAAAAFVFFSQAASMFDDVRGISMGIVKHLR
jgi:undecaprenyl-diphosphatase